VKNEKEYGAGNLARMAKKAEHRHAANLARVSGIKKKASEKYIG